MAHKNHKNIIRPQGCQNTVDSIKYSVRRVLDHHNSQFGLEIV